jgi:hypothetical protein
VHLPDVLAHLARGSKDATVAAVMRPAMVIPTLMLLPDALQELVRTTNQLACVIDEYGGFAGVLTIEDMAMEIVGARIASAPGVLSTYRESIYKTFAWCRISSFAAPPSGPGITKSKVMLMAAQPPDGSAFMPLNRIISKQTWAFHAI